MPEHQTLLSIAGLTLRVLDDAAAVPEWLADRCKPFHVPHDTKTSPALTIAIHRDSDLPVGNDQLLVKPGSQPGSFRMHGIDFVATRRRCGLPFEVEALPDAGIAGILRWVLGVALLEQGGLLLHAASFIIEGRGVACPGPSGSGKTTLSRLLQQHFPILTDETTALRFEGTLPLIYSTPFAGELGAVAGPASAPLEQLLFLRHALETQIAPLKAADAASRLMGCLFLPVRETSWMSSALELAEQVVQAVPCVAFGFRPTPDVVEVCRERFSHSYTPA